MVRESYGPTSMQQRINKGPDARGRSHRGHFTVLPKTVGGGGVFQAEDTASAKVLRWLYVWHVEETARHQKGWSRVT